MRLPSVMSFIVWCNDSASKRQEKKPDEEKGPAIYDEAPVASGKGAEPGKGGKKGKGGFGKPVSEQAVQLRLGLLFVIDVVLC